jgi:aryl-alcohol dehydrogenase-like predicted oxidoreductase
MARLVAGAALGRSYAEPLAVCGAGRVGETRVDEYAAAVLKFPGDIVAQLSTGCQLAQDSVVRIDGTLGHILVPSPWFASRDAGRCTIVVQRRGEPRPQEVVVETDRGLYSIEADTVAAHLAARQAPAMSWGDSLGNLRALDLWRKAVGVSYDADGLEGWQTTAARRPLCARAGVRMPMGRVAGVDKPVSRVVMGTMLMDSVPAACALYDDFVECGGNAFDTAYVYGGGRSEVLLGQWMKLRGNRPELVIVGKGAHTPHCTPDGITRQLRESLERLQTESMDVYLMHRDNPDVPVGEFVDVLDGHRREGRMAAFGGSNWTAARIDEANAYASRKGVPGFAAVSNNVSLARMVNPVWGGTLSFSDPASRDWLARTRIASFAWSSQARGFFVRGDAANLSDADLARCWYSDDNFRRLDRACELARERGVAPIEVALAWVLSQPFNSFALIGPASPLETLSSLRALDIRLSEREARWLDLEEESK